LVFLYDSEEVNVVRGRISISLIARDSDGNVHHVRIRGSGRSDAQGGALDLQVTGPGAQRRKLLFVRGNPSWLEEIARLHERAKKQLEPAVEPK
jgi:hypothetical protein